MSENRASGSYNLFTYGPIAQSVFDMMNADLDKKRVKELRKFLPDEADDESDLRAKILLIENYIKENVAIVDASNEDLNDVGTILSNKIASKVGMTKLVYQSLKTYDVSFELVLSCSRYEGTFSDSIENYSFLNEYLIYIPLLKDYLMPSAQF